VVEYISFKAGSIQDEVIEPDEQKKDNIAAQTAIFFQASAFSDQVKLFVYNRKREIQMAVITYVLKYSSCMII